MFFTLLMFCAAGAFSNSTALELRKISPPRPQTVVGSGGQTRGQNPSLAFTAAHVFWLFQREKGGAPRPAVPQETLNQNCMRVRERMRLLGTYSLLVVVVLAVIVYYLLMSFAARAIPPAAKWLLSPAIAAVIIALTVSWYEAGQLATVCAGESGTFRLDTFMWTGLMGFGLTLFIFVLWSLGLRRRSEKRLQAVVE